MALMKSVNYDIHLNCIEDTLCKFKTAIPAMRKFEIPTLGSLRSNSHYDKRDQWKYT